MGISRKPTSTTLHCDVCPMWRIENHGRSWDEAKLASSRAKEEGWTLSRSRGEQWKAFCPDCSAHSGYTLDDWLPGY